MPEDENSLFKPGINCWRVEHADKVTVLVDGEDYFRAVRAAMIRAKRRIVLMGWDFDARLEMHDTQGEVEGPLEVSRFFAWLLKRNPDLHIYILRWNIGMLKSLGRGRTIFTILKWMAAKRIHLKLDGYHPVGAAQHQKVVAIDRDTAFCGGIDMTDGRWDTRDHAEEQEERIQPSGADAGPWHDTAMVMQGPVAAALAEFAEARWDKLARRRIVPAQDENDCWPECIEPDFENVDIAIARTKPKMPDEDEVREIEQLYLDIIASAKRYIYAESQYFASRKIGAAIAARLKEADPPEIVIVNPIHAEGWLEPEVMDTSRARIMEALHRRDEQGRFRMYHALNEAGRGIYIHAKLLITDDEVLRIGSSNFNNRSLGFDTECDVALEARGDAEVSARIAAVRNDLLAEHLNKTVEEIAELFERTGSLIETIQLARGPGRTLRDYQTPDLTEIEKWLADNDAFDPKNTDDNFATIVKAPLRSLQRAMRSAVAQVGGE